MILTPFEKIERKLKDEIPQGLIKKLPDKWKKIGDVLIIVLPPFFDKYKKTIGEIYADALKCKTVLNDNGGIYGELRNPCNEVIFGPEDTETIHKENNVRFKLDPQKVMFSSGNMDERIRMSTISNEKETVVDMFTGIGYFTIPMAVYSKPKKIYAIEKNPESFDFLKQNISLNNVSSIVEPLIGDNRKIAPKNIADRVIMGYIGDTHRFLNTAFDCLKNHSGIIHYHDKFPGKNIPNKPMKIIEKEAEKNSCKVEMIQYKHVKSYAPGISHYVFDLRIDEI